MAFGGGIRVLWTLFLVLIKDKPLKVSSEKRLPMGKIEFPMGKSNFPWVNRMSGPLEIKSYKVNKCIFTYLTLSAN